MIVILKEWLSGYKADIKNHQTSDSVSASDDSEAMNKVTKLQRWCKRNQ